MKIQTFGIILFINALMFNFSFSQTTSTVVFSDDNKNSTENRTLSIDQDGNIVFANAVRGIETFFDNEFGNPDHQTIQLFKTTNAGDLIWSREISGNWDVWIHSMAVDNNNSIYISGQSSSDTLMFNGQVFEIDTTNKRSNFILKISPDGDIINQVNFCCSGRVTSMNVNSKNELITTGTFNVSLKIKDTIFHVPNVQYDTTFYPWGDTIVQINSNTNCFLAQFNSELELDSFININNFGYLTHTPRIKIDEDDNLYSAITSRFPIEINHTLLGNNHYDDNVIITKWDENFRVNWNIETRGDSGMVSITDMKIKNNNLYLTGFFRGNKTIGDLTIQDDDDYEYRYILKVHEKGNPLWLNRYEYTWGLLTVLNDDRVLYLAKEYYPSFRYDYCTIDDNGVMISKESIGSYTEENVGFSPRRIVSRDEDVVILAGGAYRGLSLGSEIIIEDQSKMKHFLIIRKYPEIITSIYNFNFGLNHIFPNPVKDHLFLDKTYDQITITNTQGVSMFKAQNLNKINCENLKSGIYFLSTLKNGISSKETFQISK